MHSANKTLNYWIIFNLLKINRYIFTQINANLIIRDVFKRQLFKISNYRVMCNFYVTDNPFSKIILFEFLSPPLTQTRYKILVSVTGEYKWKEPILYFVHYYFGWSGINGLKMEKNLPHLLPISCKKII